MVRRVMFAVSIASLMALGSIVPVLADGPTTQSNEMDNWKGPQEPVGPGQKAIAETKRALAAGMAVTTRDGQAVQTAGAGDLTVAALTERLVGTWEREQQLSYTCGPTAVQVVADWVWNMGPNAVKYTQATISTRWTHTTTAGTDATHELAGANGVLVGSPRASFPLLAGQPDERERLVRQAHHRPGFQPPQHRDLVI